MNGNLLPLGCDARLRGEQVHLRHVLPVPRQRDLFGMVLRPHFRATVIHANGQFTECDLRELQPIDA